MASQSQGIQQLLAAEKKAAELVSGARKKKTKRLKEAKEEAQAEIENFRKEREKTFQDYQREHYKYIEDRMTELKLKTKLMKNTHMGSKDEFVLLDEQDTREKLVEIEKSVEQNKGEVINRILSLVYDIKPELHQNFRL